jgi:hypothetical protein
MLQNGKTASLVAAALLLSGLVLVGDAATDVRAESAYPSVGDLPAKRDKPSPITVDEQSKLKKELNDARDRQNSQVKGGDGAAQQKSKKR